MRRPGYTLVELIVAMTMTSSVVAIGVGLLHRIMREQQFATSENGLHRVAERLSGQLREDVHASLRAEFTETDADGRSQLILFQPDSTVTYALHEGSLERQATSEDAATHRDSFAFPARYRLAWDQGLPRGQVGLTLHVFPSTETMDDLARSGRRAAMRVAASLGRDLRFTKTGDIP